jgi:shikimate kinase
MSGNGATNQRIILTGFMGVGKSTVARFLAFILKCKKIDLDSVIEETERRKIAEIFQTDGEEYYRQVETANLTRVLTDREAQVIALGGGAWTIEENRRIIKQHDFTTVWLESTFEHCWRNISFSKRVRPLAKNKTQARQLFNERQKVYCLADWHFVVRPDLTSYEIAKKIAEEVFSVKK